MRLAVQTAVVCVLALLALLGTQPGDASSAIIHTCLPVVCSSLPSAEPAEATPEGQTEASLSFAEEMMLSLINGERIESGLTALEVDNKLVQLATIRSLDMAENNYFSHTAPDGSSARSLMIDSKIGPGIMGEILGRNNSTDTSESVTSVVEAFLASPGHHAAILNPRFVSTGIGTAIDPENMSYYTILFFGP